MATCGKRRHARAPDVQVWNESKIAVDNDKIVIDARMCARSLQQSERDVRVQQSSQQIERGKRASEIVSLSYRLVQKLNDRSGPPRIGWVTYAAERIKHLNT